MLWLFAVVLLVFCRYNPYMLRAAAIPLFAWIVALVVGLESDSDEETFPARHGDGPLKLTTGPNEPNWQKEAGALAPVFFIIGILQGKISIAQIGRHVFPHS